MLLGPSFLTISHIGPTKARFVAKHPNNKMSNDANSGALQGTLLESNFLPDIRHFFAPNKCRTSQKLEVRCPICNALLDISDSVTEKGTIYLWFETPQTCDELERAVVTPCGHVFGHGCMRLWMAREPLEDPLCPICREPLTYARCRHHLKLHLLPAYVDMLRGLHTNHVPLTKPEGGNIPETCVDCHAYKVQRILQTIQDIAIDWAETEDDTSNAPFELLRQLQNHWIEIADILWPRVVSDGSGYIPSSRWPFERSLGTNLEEIAMTDWSTWHEIRRPSRNLGATLFSRLREEFISARGWHLNWDYSLQQREYDVRYPLP
jgi:hypothetical protein